LAANHPGGAIEKAPRGDPQAISLYQQATAKVGQLGIQILAISEQLVLAATGFSQQFELLTDDALIVAVMRQQGLTKIASEDADFDRVPGLTRYGPG
jgi:predicted nucleic acid-binding protein